jgi:signal transduction histidine kinase
VAVQRRRDDTWEGAARAPLSESALAALGSVAHEITLDIERRQVETALRESEERFRLRTLELEKANKELEAFSHTLSHDLRNSLGVIQHYSHVLLTARWAGVGRGGSRQRRCLLLHAVIARGQRLLPQPGALSEEVGFFAVLVDVEPLVFDFGCGA